MGMQREDGISEVVGSVLLIALTVVGVTIVVALLLSGTHPVEVPVASLTPGTTADGTFVLVHEGGDPLEAGTYRLYVDAGDGPVDRTDKFLLDGDGAWSPGEAMKYTDGELDGRVIVTALVGGGETVIAEPGASGVITAVVDEGGSTPGPGPGPGPGDAAVKINSPTDGGLLVFSGHPQYFSTVRASVTGGTVESVRFILESSGGGLPIEGVYTADRGPDGKYYAEITTNYGQLKKMTGQEVTIRAVAYDDAGIAVARDSVAARIQAAE
ncbi:type IV pilin [Methanofollis aquaemaris]|uniref:Type IV pilin n=1 Tax=Methanofollis aquaemaris TaxID=126734 RepID=A0A8A3S7U2_9EURY|nr:type IV pilin N-terminal domain-containing protein [Methanofollis aquaemaris]QSZ67754.1 type IV pilin [Methanofollis aquaemaris]